MKALHVVLRPLSAFGTPLAGDTLFGQLCWALRLRGGTELLDPLLAGYTEGRPFLVVSDAFPAGLLPRPTAPDSVMGLGAVSARVRKQLKRRQWLPVASRHLPLPQWLQEAQEAEVGRSAMLTQNTINRLTGTTGTGPFAPRQVDQTVFMPGQELDLYLVHDPERLSEAPLIEALSDIGAGGYGRDASAGLGKFEVLRHGPSVLATGASHRAVVTLAPCAPEPELLDAEGCFCQPLTRFGRHGSIAALGGGGGPFKRPVLLARTGALLSLRTPAAPLFHGCGLGGVRQPVSGVLPATVHQGYAPVVGVAGELSS